MLWKGLIFSCFLFPCSLKACFPQQVSSKENLRRLRVLQNVEIQQNCAVSATDRMSCGTNGILQDACLALGCCWEAGTDGGNSTCFHAASAMPSSFPTMGPSLSFKPTSAPTQLSTVATNTKSSSSDDSRKLNITIAACVVVGIILCASCCFVLYSYWAVYFCKRSPATKKPVAESESPGEPINLLKEIEAHSWAKSPDKVHQTAHHSQRHILFSLPTVDMEEEKGDNNDHTDETKHYEYPASNSHPNYYSDQEVEKDLYNYRQRLARRHDWPEDNNHGFINQ